MKIPACLALTACLCVSVHALDPAKQPPLPERPIAVKKELLFSDDFKGAERDKRWHRVVDTTVETVGEEMRVSIDGTVAAYLKSEGIGHPTKSKIELGVAGKSGWFEEIKVWNAERAR